MHLLIIEDDQLMLNEIRRSLSEVLDFEIMTASTGREALHFTEIIKDAPVVVVLDLGLPDVSGLDLMQTIAYRPNIAIIVVTAHTDQAVKLSSLAGGADAFLTKPFDPAELLLTISAVRRRVFSKWKSESTNSRWHLAPREWALYAPNGSVIKLTVAETHLLDLLHRFKGRPVSRLKIGDELGDFYRYSGNALEATISRLRKKVSAIDPDIQLIKAVSGTGYVLSTEVD